jgi:hypothetical protein
MLMAPYKWPAFFKVTEGGYVFRAPNPWVVGQANGYFVTEAQKAQILNGMSIPRWAIRALLLWFFAVWFGGSALIIYSHSGRPDLTTVDVAIIITSAFAAILLPLSLLRHLQRHRLKPILPTLRPTGERISFHEIAEAARKATSAREYARNSMLHGIAFGIMMLIVGLEFSTAINKGSYVDLMLSSIVAIGFGCAMVLSGRLAMRKANES